MPSVAGVSVVEVAGSSDKVASVSEFIAPSELSSFVVELGVSVGKISCGAASSVTSSVVVASAGSLFSGVADASVVSSL